MAFYQARLTAGEGDGAGQYTRRSIDGAWLHSEAATRMNIAVIDIGSPKKNNIGWAIVAPTNEVEGTSTRASARSPKQ